MKKMRSSSSFGVNIGTSSLLLVFVILCLISFATLSIVSADADKKLGDKVIERTSGYYNACNEANERLMTIDETLRLAYDSGLSRDEYYAQVGENISFCVPVSDIQSLQVNSSINYPSENDESFYTITCCYL